MYYNCQMLLINLDFKAINSNEKIIQILIKAYFGTEDFCFSYSKEYHRNLHSFGLEITIMIIKSYCWPSTAMFITKICFTSTHLLNPLRWRNFPNIQLKGPRVQLEAISSFLTVIWSTLSLLFSRPNTTSYLSCSSQDWLSKPSTSFNVFRWTGEDTTVKLCISRNQTFDFYMQHCVQHAYDNLGKRDHIDHYIL